MVLLLLMLLLLLDHGELVNLEAHRMERMPLAVHLFVRTTGLKSGRKRGQMTLFGASIRCAELRCERTERGLELDEML